MIERAWEKKIEPLTVLTSTAVRITGLSRSRISAADVQERVFLDQVTGSSADIDRVFRIENKGATRSAARQRVIGAYTEPRFGADHYLGRDLVIVADKRTTDEGVVLIG